MKKFWSYGIHFSDLHHGALEFASLGPDRIIFSRKLDARVPEKLFIERFFANFKPSKSNNCSKLRDKAKV